MFLSHNGLCCGTYYKLTLILIFTYTANNFFLSCSVFIIRGFKRVVPKPYIVIVKIYMDQYSSLKSDRADQTRSRREFKF